MGGMEDGGERQQTIATRRRRLSWFAGLAMVSAGLMLLIGVGAYYAYASFARSQLDELNYSGDVAITVPTVVAGGVAEPEGSQESLISSGEAEVNGAASPDSSFANFTENFPGIEIHPKYWDDPLWAGADPYERTGLPASYVPLSADSDGVSLGLRAAATEIAIPAIGVDASVRNLRILDLGDSLAWETPDNIVGHIPQTANPGEDGNGWFFAHLESLIRGEGSIFRNLPKVPDLLREGDPVYVSLFSEDGEYLYQVITTKVVHQDDLEQYTTDEAAVTLVTCVPRLVYDHRLVVTAELVGFRN